MTDALATIKWKYSTELLVVNDIIDDEPVFKQETWFAGQIEDVIILADRDGCVDLQFGDGSVTYNVDKSLYIEITTT